MNIYLHTTGNIDKYFGLYEFLNYCVLAQHELVTYANCCFLTILYKVVILQKFDLDWTVPCLHV